MWVPVQSYICGFWNECVKMKRLSHPVWLLGGRHTICTCIHNRYTYVHKKAVLLDSASYDIYVCIKKLFFSTVHPIKQ